MLSSVMMVMPVMKMTLRMTNEEQRRRRRRRRRREMVLQEKGELV